MRKYRVAQTVTIEEVWYIDAPNEEEAIRMVENCDPSREFIGAEPIETSEIAASLVKD